MANNPTVIFSVVGSGETIGPNVPNGAKHSVGMVIPAIQRQVFLQGSWDTTSATFSRIQVVDPTAGTANAIAIASANAIQAVNISGVLPFPWIRVELGAGVTTDVSTFVFIQKVL